MILSAANILLQIKHDALNEACLKHHWRDSSFMLTSHLRFMSAVSSATLI